MIELWDRKENLNDYRFRVTYDKFPVWLWKLLCFFKIKHNGFLIEYHTIDPVTKKDLGWERSYGIEECVYCQKRWRKKK